MLTSSLRKVLMRLEKKKMNGIHIKSSISYRYRILLLLSVNEENDNDGDEMMMGGGIFPIPLCI